MSHRNPVGNIAWAIHQNNLPQLKRYLQDDPDLFRRVSDCGSLFCEDATIPHDMQDTWVHYAAANCPRIDEKLYRFMLDNGGKEVIEIGRDDATSSTALFLAKLHGNFEASETLMEYGADTSMKAMRGFNDLHFAARNGGAWRLEARTDFTLEDFHAVNGWKETPLDSMRNLDPDKGTKPLPMFKFLLEGGALNHPEKGSWRPHQFQLFIEGRESGYYGMLLENNLLPELFDEKYWRGFEAEAVKLRDRMLEVAGEGLAGKLHAEFAKIDFAPFERGAPPAESAAVRFLKARSGQGERQR